MNRLRQLRIQHGYKTQQDLAKVLFVNQTAVSQWERGATIPSNQMLVKLSEMYGVSIDYLLGRTDRKEIPTPEIEGGPNHELWKLIEQIPESRMPEVERYLRFQAETKEKP